MKKLFLICFLLSFNTVLFGQEKSKPFKDGEWLKYKMSYSGFFKAGTAELTLKETDLNGKKVFHAKGLEKQVILSVGFLKLETPINLTLIILK